MATEKQKVEALAGLTVDEIQRAWKFYNNEIYDDGYIQQFDLFDDIKEIFNPVPKIAFIMNALTVQKHLDFEIIDNTQDGQESSKNESNNDNDTEDTKKEIIEAFWEYNEFQKMKYLLLLWLILSKRAI